MTRRDVISVHCAGEPDGPLQRCSACAEVIQDNTAWFAGRVAVPEGASQQGPSWWPVGARVARDTGFPTITYMVSDRPLDDDEQPCTASVR